MLGAPTRSVLAAQWHLQRYLETLLDHTYNDEYNGYGYEAL
jgi:hypothetical protein